MTVFRTFASLGYKYNKHDKKEFLDLDTKTVHGTWY